MRTIGTLLNHIEQLAQTKKIGTILFTTREIDIIACLANGWSAKKIAALLAISPKTVEVHIRNIMLKLGCHSNEKIIDFIEHAQIGLSLRNHYYIILEKHYFNIAGFIDNMFIWNIPLS